MGSVKNTLLAVAPNGGRRTQADHPRLPITPAELAQTAVACAEAGANLFHLHVRDAAGKHTLDPDAYQAALKALREAVGQRLVVQITTEAIGQYAPAEQMAVVRAVKPEAVSLSVRELFSQPRQTSEAAAFLRELWRDQVMVQYILYDLTDQQQFRDLRTQGLIPEDDPWTLHVLGRYGQAENSTPADLLNFLPVDATERWSLCAFGPSELACLTCAATLGGHVRVGFENNLHAPDGTLAESNEAQVARLNGILLSLNRLPMTADELRESWFG